MRGAHPGGSFLSLRTNPDLPVRVIATGLSFGILLDAVVIRTLLVPARVVIMGRWNWWMPPSLSRLLRIAPTDRARTRSGDRAMTARDARTPNHKRT